MCWCDPSSYIPIKYLDFCNLFYLILIWWKVAVKVANTHYHCCFYSSTISNHYSHVYFFLVMITHWQTGQKACKLNSCQTPPRLASADMAAGQLPVSIHNSFEGLFIYLHVRNNLTLKNVFLHMLKVYVCGYHTLSSMSLSYRENRFLIVT